MAYQEVGAKRTYHKFKDLEPGTVVVEGVFKRTIQSRYGDQYEFEADDGEVHVLNKSGQLAYKMDFIREGDRAKIIYEGQEMLENGLYKGKMAHQFTVLRDDSFDESAITDSDDDDLDLDEELDDL